MTSRRHTTAKEPQHTTAVPVPSTPARPTAVTPDVYQRMFVGMALQMSWQLALVVVVPIIGGHVLDDHYHTSPWLTLGGFAFALLGVYGVLYKTVAEANERTGSASPKEKS